MKQIDFVLFAPDVYEAWVEAAEELSNGLVTDDGEASGNKKKPAAEQVRGHRCLIFEKSDISVVWGPMGEEDCEVGRAARDCLGCSRRRRWRGGVARQRQRARTHRELNA